MENKTFDEARKALRTIAEHMKYWEVFKEKGTKNGF